jgi:DNA-binding transcriptional LysR family regulator
MRLSDRIGRRIKLQDVHVLMVVVQAGSMGKAARQLNTSQPNISKSIADLEHALGVRLLDRHRRGIEPTQYGRALLDGGSAVFDELRQTVKNIEFLADPAAGEVRIGSNPLLAASFTTAIVDRLSRRFPRMKFRLTTGYVEELHRGLREREFDLLIAWNIGPLSDDRLSFEFLFDDSWVIATGAQSPWARRRKIAIPDLMKEQWVLPPPESAVTSMAIEALAAGGFGYPHQTVLTDSPHVRMSLLATGRFLTICPMSTLRFSTHRLELKILPVEVPMARVPSGIVTLKNRTLSPVAQLFIETAGESARRVTESG